MSCGALRCAAVAVHPHENRCIFNRMSRRKEIPTIG